MPAKFSTLADDAVLAASRCCNPLRAWARRAGSLFARSFLVFNVEDDVVYFVVFAQQALQWSTSFRRPKFHCRGFFPLRNEVLGLLIKVNIGTKRYREQLSNLL